MLPILHADFSLTAEDVRESADLFSHNAKSSKYRRTGRVLMALGMGVLIVGLVANAMGGSRLGTGASFANVLVVVMLVIAFISFVRSHRQFAEATKGRPHYYVFRDGVMHWATPDGEGMTPMSAFMNWYESENLFGLLQTTGSTEVIPKRAFRGPDESAFREMLTETVGPVTASRLA